MRQFLSMPVSNSSEGKMCRQHLVWPVLIILTLAVFAQVRRFDFVNFDDDIYVTAEHHVLGGLSWRNIGWAFSTLDAAFYHPLTWCSLMLDTNLASTVGQWLGFNSAGWFHATNVAIHLASVLLLFAVLKQMTGAVWKSALVAILFAVHPLHVESVAWVTERKDVLSTFFGMLAMWGYVRYTNQSCPGWYLFTFFMFCCSLLSKSMLVTLPFLFLLLDYWPLGRFRGTGIGGRGLESRTECKDSGQQSVETSEEDWDVGDESESIVPKPVAVSRLIFEKIPLIAITIVFCVLTFIGQQKRGAIATLESFSLTTRLENAVVVYVTYLRKAFWPSDLIVNYSHPGDTIPVSDVITAAVILLLVSAVVIFQIRRRPYLFVGWSWYLGTLIPVIGLVQLWSFQMADRFTYVPLIGPFVGIVWGIGSLVSSSKNSRTVFSFSIFVIVVAFTVLGYQQTSRWRNSFTLFSHAIRASPIISKTVPLTANNLMIQNSLGISLAKEGHSQQAIARFQKALELDSGFALAHFNLGTSFVFEEDYERALRHFQQSIHFDPNYAPAYHSLGSALADQGMFEKAVPYFEKALSIDPSYARSHHALGLILQIQEKLDLAEAYLLKSVELDPRNARAFFDLGMLYQQQDKRADAASCFLQALSLEPAFSEAAEELRRMQ